MLRRIVFLNPHLLLSIAGNFLQVFGTLICLLEVFAGVHTSIIQRKLPILGLGATLVWLSALSHLKYAASFNLMNQVLFRAQKSVFFFLVGVIPLFYAFAFLFEALFASLPNFDGLLLITQSLFAISLGDSIRDYFTETRGSGYVGHFMLIFYMICFFTAVQNIFIALIMENYNQVRTKRTRKHDAKTHRKLAERQYSETAQRPALLLQARQRKHLVESLHSRDDSERLINDVRKSLESTFRTLEGKLAACEEQLSAVERSELTPHEKSEIRFQLKQKTEKVLSILYFELQ